MSAAATILALRTFAMLPLITSFRTCRDLELLSSSSTLSLFSLTGGLELLSSSPLTELRRERSPCALSPTQLSLFCVTELRRERSPCALSPSPVLFPSLTASFFLFARSSFFFFLFRFLFCTFFFFLFFHTLFQY